MAPDAAPSREHADLLETLGKHRFFLRNTLRELTAEQAAATPTASALCLGGIVRHVTAAERGWTAFMNGGAEAMQAAAAGSDWMESFRFDPATDTIEGVLAAHAEVTAATDALLQNGIDLDAEHELPKAPWFAPGACWSNRRVMVHLIAEISQHAGHADIIRETIDGARSMG